MAWRYRSLDGGKIAQTVAVLRDRIEERFPGSGLGRVAAEFYEVAVEAVDRSRWVNRPLVWLRVVVGVLVAVMLSVLVAGLFQLRLSSGLTEFSSFVQVLESGLNDIVLIGAGIYFLLTLETRFKRKVVLRAVHELRSLAHIVDTHQLTKDPDRLVRAGANTASSPRRSMTAFELSRYLGYCSEMLSLIGKVGALYVQDFDDEMALEAVDDIEDLTTGLSRKIWQKIALLGEPGRLAV
jgi:hypothetical protein